jgi:hypothetical protein
MKDLRSIVAAIRASLGWSDLSETRLSPAHGWLLRPTPPSQEPPSKKADTHTR